MQKIVPKGIWGSAEEFDFKQGIKWWLMFDQVLANDNQVAVNVNQVLTSSDLGLADENQCVLQSVDQVLADGNQVLAKYYR